jgi:AcrR family transcriptional regulator
VVDTVNQPCASWLTVSTHGYHGGVDSTRDRLLEAATRLLDEGGPAAVTLREVGRLAGVSHNAPYKHFASKQDLLAAIAARELCRMSGDQSSLDLPGPGDSIGRLRQMMHSYIRWATRHPARFKLTFGPWADGPAELADAAAAARATLATAVQAAQQAGTLPQEDRERVATLILAAAHGAADLAISGHLSRTGKGHASAEDLVDDLLRYLGQAGRA